MTRTSRFKSSVFKSLKGGMRLIGLWAFAIQVFLPLDAMADHKLVCSAGGGATARLVRKKVISSISAKFVDFPATATIVYSNRSKDAEGHICGAVVLSRKWLVTAAHCLTGCPSESPEEISVRYGGDAYTSNGTGHEMASAITIERLVNHPDLQWVRFKDKGLSSDPDAEYAINDIALVELAQEMDISESSGVVAATIAADQLVSDAIDSGEPDFAIAGFGATADGYSAPENRMKTASMPLAKTEHCNDPQEYDGAVDQGSMLCVGSAEKRDLACRGDSGSGLFLGSDEKKTVLAGLVSWTLDCNRKSGFGVYTNVIQYRDWINNNISQ